MEITDAKEELDNANAYLYFVKALMERIFDVKAFKKSGS